METPETPKETPEIPKKTRGRSKEFLAEISKKGNEIQKKRATVNAYEKAKKKKELEEKFNMIQAELAKSKELKNITPEKSNDTEEIQQQPIEEKKPPPSIKTKKPKKIVEVIEEVEDETDEEEEEVIVKRIIKKKPIKKVTQVTNEDFIKQTNMEMLKNKFNEDIQRRIRLSLFDD
jgi:hypothetical protein